VIEGRLVELEWPQRLRLGESDVVRLALIPGEEGYLLTSEFPEHQVLTQTLAIKRPAGYELWAAARLDGVGFDISPAGETSQSLPPNERAEWRWSLAARQAGRQRLSVTLLLNWEPAAGTALPRLERQVFSRGLEIQVATVFGLTQAQAFAGGLTALLFGGGLSLYALLAPGRRGAALAGLRLAEPNPAVQIEARPGIDLSAAEQGLFQALFDRYARLLLEGEFLSGYSGARTFLAAPVLPDGRRDAYTIIKVGGAASIQREYQNYEIYVRHTLPPVTARIQHPPVTLRPTRGAAPEALAAVQYTFLGEGGRLPASLRQALLASRNPAFLRSLFDTFGPTWWLQRKPYTFRLAQEYDRLLPSHYLLEPCLPPAAPAPLLDGRTPPEAARLEIGAVVRLCNFAPGERRPRLGSLSLAGQAAPGQPPLRLRWQNERYTDGATGRVIATRSSLLHGWTAGFERLDLPDPLERLPVLLAEMVTGSMSTIHGDLNLENALVGPGGMVWLIDFAQTRDGHTLYDFAHLFAELVAHLLAPQALEPRQFVDLLGAASRPPADPLLAAVEGMAAACLARPGGRREFDLAVYAACLGALKYANLDERAKRCLYLAAAHRVSLID
jgi:hypothetical protein